MKKIPHIIQLGIIVLFISSCDAPIHEEIAFGEPYCLNEDFKNEIELATALVEEVKEGIHLTASVEANPDKVLKYVSLIDGIISKVYFSLGDQVTKGQTLAELSSVELSNWNSTLSNINNEIKVAEQKLKSVQSMYEDGIASQKDLLEAESKLAILKSEKQNIENNLKLYSASSTKGVFKIKAPSSGVITEKSISSGTQISTDSEPLFTISGLDEVWIMVDIYATDVQHIKIGMHANMTTISYPDTIFEGKIQAISQILDTESKVLKARIVLPNPELKLKPGMLVDVIALKNQSIKAIGVPTESLVFDDNQDYLVVYKSDCEIENRKIEILTKSNGTTFIKSGISENEQVVSKNQLLVYEQIKNHSK